jgi:hypothetical protein
MIRERKKLDRFYRDLIQRENISHKEALSIYESLHREALSLGIINSQNILDELEVDIRVAKAINELA